MRVAEALAGALLELEVDTAFGLVGSGNFHLTGALVRGGGRFVAARHEGAAITMADAYTRVSGRLCACTVHQGPGMTNLMTGLAEAAKARTPLLVLAADSPAAALRSNFRIDQAGLAAAVGALHQRAGSPESALADLARAHRRARLERRPVVVSLPIDVQEGPAPDLPLPRPSPPPAPLRPPAEAVARAADLLVAARRPLILAGRGAVLAGAGERLARLAEATGALLATSAMANGLFAGRDFVLGVAGGFASPFAAELIRDADLVLAFGATLNMWTTRHGRLLGPGARVVQVDVEADAIGAHARADLGLVADAGEAAEALCRELERRGHRPDTWRTPELARRVRERSWAGQPFADASDGERIDPRTLSIALDRLLPRERLVAVDSGHFMGWPVMYWQVPDERGFVFTQAFQSVGLGLASAVGAAVARPDRLVVAALGDGGALMAASELETVVRLGLPLLIVVYDDAAYGAEVHHFGPDPGPLDIVRFPDADLAALARGAGAEGVTVRRVEDLEAVERWLPERRQPLLVDAKVAPTVVAEWLSEAFGH
jgi:thiamine pyrophosphate-dependent acetolactate synthase large subunit-like protein